jgi:murein L,D-transpeptidase YcbB/YkuD
MRAAPWVSLAYAALLACAFQGANPGEANASVSVSDSAQADISDLVAREAWIVRFRSTDHGARRAMHAAYDSGRGPIWVLDAQPTEQAAALIHVLQGAETYGLDPQDYFADSLGSLAQGTTGARRSGGRARADGAAYDEVADSAAERWATFDVSLSAAALKFICDLHYGRIDPRAAGFELGAPRPDDLDLAGELRALARSSDIPRQLAVVEPQFLHYRLLEQALPRYRTLAAQTPTPAALARLRQIDFTLERWRWLPAFQTPPIIVNIPEFRLFAFRTTADRAADILQMDVIVGRTFPRTRTPVFVADMKSIIFRPYWDVPRSITLSEMLPKIRSHPGFLAAQHLEIVRGATDSARPLPATAENIEALATGAARLRQRPGPDNALGLIKFDLPNPHDVYVHSTPAQQLFRRSRRAFSHGCIRVSDPVALATYALRDTPGDWTPEKIEAAMKGTDTRRVGLARSIRVLILYGTVLAKENGEVLFFDDLYGQDRKLQTLLNHSQRENQRGPLREIGLHRAAAHG